MKVKKEVIIMLTAFLASLFLTTGNLQAGWGIKYLDPTCKNGGLRKTCRENDQKCKAAQARLEKISQDISKKSSMLSSDMVEKIRQYAEKQAKRMTKKEMETRPSQDSDEVFEKYFAIAFSGAVAGGVGGFFVAGPAGVLSGAINGCATSIAGMAAMRGVKGELANWHGEGN